jgi:hypothetical protein
MELNLGNKAATQQSWQREFAIRVVIGEIQAEHPRANERRLIELVAERILEDDKARFAAAEYAVKHALSAQQGYARQAATAQLSSPAQRAEYQAKQRTEIAEAAKYIANQVLWLNMEMPNGKRLRYCDGNYIASIGGKLAKAGKKAGRKLMGQVFDEESLCKFIDG